MSSIGLQQMFQMYVDRRIPTVVPDLENTFAAVGRVPQLGRVGNTYRGGEVSNHLFGIAIDIDPDKNPCCGCVDPWPTHPLCKLVGASIWEKTALPKCWVQAFERYGFYWLGRDVLQDTGDAEGPDHLVVALGLPGLFSRLADDRHDLGLVIAPVEVVADTGRGCTFRCGKPAHMYLFRLW